MVASEEKLRQLDIRLKYFQNVGKSQSFYVNSLTAFLFLVWLIEILHQTGGVTLSILGASVQIAGLWDIVPLVTAVLTLALAGTVNLMQHAARRLYLCLIECEEEEPFWVEIDPHRNILDYIGFLTLRLKTPVLPDTVAAAKSMRTSWRVSTLLYPALILLSIVTTYASLSHLPWRSLRSFVYVIVSMALQLVYSWPFVRRKFWTFFGIHKSMDDGVDWGTDALYAMPLSALKKAISETK